MQTVLECKLEDLRCDLEEAREEGELETVLELCQKIALIEGKIRNQKNL